MMIWLNGEIQANQAGRIDPMDRGFTLGDGVFETLRIVNQTPQFFERHLQRLRKGLALLAIPLNFTNSELLTAIENILQASKLDNAAVRLTISRGPSQRGLLPANNSNSTVLITAEPLIDNFSEVKTIVCTITKRNELSPLCHIKSLNYLDNIIARQEAMQHGADDAILLNTRGFVTEATASNIIVLRSNKPVTPPLHHGALPGVVREVLIEKFSVNEAPLLVEDLYDSQAILLVNSLFLRPVSSVNGRLIAMQTEWLEKIRSQMFGGLYL